jgi:hypothetical protein
MAKSSAASDLERRRRMLDETPPLSGSYLSLIFKIHSQSTGASTQKLCITYREYVPPFCAAFCMPSIHVVGDQPSHGGIIVRITRICYLLLFEQPEDYMPAYDPHREDLHQNEKGIASDHI